MEKHFNAAGIHLSAGNFTGVDESVAAAELSKSHATAAYEQALVDADNKIEAELMRSESHDRKKTKVTNSINNFRRYEADPMADQQISRV